MSIARKLLASAGGAPIEGWDLANAAYTATPINWFYLGSQAAGQNGIFFKPDGTKMYTCSSASDSVHQYDLSTAWDVSTASYSSSKSVATEEASPQGLFFKPDGTKMYIIGSVGDDVNEYSLSTAWNVSTASYVRNFSVISQDGAPYDISFSSDGTQMYMLGGVGDDVNQYSLSTAWNISTASYVRTAYVGAEDSTPTGHFFKDDGTKMYTTGNTGDEINEYNLSTAWDVSTISHVQNFSIAAQELAVSGVFFKSDGTKMYVLGSTNVFQYDLSTAWNIGTASFTNPTSDFFSVLSEEQPRGIFLSPDGSNLYVIGRLGDDVNQYSLSTAWNVSTASYVQNFSIGAQESNPESIFFSPDGTSMYVLGTSGDDVNQYSLSTAWDVSTASYVRTRSIGSQELTPSGVFFKPDGTKMYVIGTSGDDVNEYSLSTAWNVSTASYVQTSSVSAQDTSPQDLFFKPDGTKMYVIGSNGDNVNEYSLSTAWNVSTASYVQNFSVAGTGEGFPTSLFFKTDGTKMYIAGTNKSIIFAYSLV